ncbi:MAG: hypothetical protein ABIR84_01245 [Candidatus Nitrotoga sp.]
MRRGPSHTHKTFTAQRIFTDREIPQAAFINAVHEAQSNTQYRILNFHGIGGQGKTALCEQFTLTLAHERQQNGQLGWAKLDFEVLAHRSIASALLEIRLQLGNNARSRFRRLTLLLLATLLLLNLVIVYKIHTRIYSSSPTAFYKMPKKSSAI